MPPRTRKEIDETIIRNDNPPLIAGLTNVVNTLLKVGDLVNIVNGGRTLQNYEVLAMDDRFIKFRADMSVAPQTEVVLIPYAQIEAIGLVGVR